MSSCAILISRQPLRPFAATSWVKSMLTAVEWAVAQGFTVNASVGTTVWDLLTVGSARAGARIRLFVPVSNGDPTEAVRQRIRREYELAPDRTEFAPVTAEGGRRGMMAARDSALVSGSEVLVPVSVRPGGSMEALVGAAGPQVRVVRDFALPYSARDEQLKYGLAPDSLSAEAAGMGRQYLVHWTRTSNGPWPGETVADFCRALLDSPHYPRDAFAGLRNMLVTGRIASSPRHMPGNTPCVSFTGKSPAEFAPLMRWRARYREMSFEPYGIGVKRSAALAVGVERVSYGPSGGSSPDTPLWLRQSEGRITMWRDEDEYRCLGDFGLSAVPREKLVCFCRSPVEAAGLVREHGVRTVAVCRE
jgi:hypothetical protein